MNSRALHTIPQAADGAADTSSLSLPSFSPKVLSALTTLLSIPFFFLQLKTAPLFVPVCAIGCGLLGFFASLSSRQRAWGALGLLLPLAAIVGPGAINLTVSGIVLGLSFRPDRTRPPSSSTESQLAAPFLLIFAIWSAAALHTLVQDFDPLITRTILEAGGIAGLYHYFVFNPAPWLLAITELCGLGLVLLLALEFHRDRAVNNQRLFFPALCLGLFVGEIFALCQLFRLHPLFDVNRGPFWELENRFSASFADPNAFGVMAVMLAPLLWSWSRSKVTDELYPMSPKSGGRRGALTLATVVAVGLLLLAPFSGSRTFFLGMGMLLLVPLGRLIFRGPKFRRLGTATLIFLAALLVVYPRSNEALQRFMPSPGAGRLLQTLNWEHFPQAFMSRVIFAKIALRVIEEHPIGGVGLARFQAVVPETAQALGLGTGGWSDNANNFYLHLVAEQGFISGVLTLLSFFLIANLIRRRSDATPGVVNRCAAGLLLLFSVLLLTGPHTLFEEVRLTVFLLVALSVPLASSGEQRARLWGEKKLLLATVAMSVGISLVVFLLPMQSTARGWYGLEHGGGDETVRWMGRSATVAICAAPGEIVVRTLQPNVSSANPVIISTQRNGQPLGEISLSSASWTALPESHQIQPGDKLRFDVSRVWSPSATGGADSRYLGAMVRWSKAFCR